MKKTIVLTILILMILTSAFAYKSYLNFGFGYQFKYGDIFHKNPDYSNIQAEKYMDNLFAFDLEYQGSFKNGLTLYDKADVGLSKGFSLQRHGMTFADQSHKQNVEFAGSFGIGYAFNPNDTLRIMLAAGPRVEGIIFTEIFDGDNLPEVIENIGIELNTNLNVYFNRHIGLNFSLVPAFNILNLSALFDNENIEEIGPAFGLTAHAAAGLSIRF